MGARQPEGRRQRRTPDGRCRADLPGLRRTLQFLGPFGFLERALSGRPAPAAGPRSTSGPAAARSQFDQAREKREEELQKISS